jgi:hypothetical protein
MRIEAMRDPIEIGFQTFARDGGEEFGAVRQLLVNGDLVVYVENAGDFVVSKEAIESVHSGKLILRPSKLESGLREAIGHAHDREEQGW